jgi:Txe/YoeB family toxin of toxin-antitoxin system
VRRAVNSLSLTGEKRLMYKLVFRKRAQKQMENYPGDKALSRKLAELFELLEEDHFLPPYEKLVGNLDGAYSRRINLQHRLVYTVDEKSKEVLIHSCWIHYKL